MTVLLVGFASTGFGMATWAYLSDADTSGANAMTGGTLDVHLNGSNDYSNAFGVTNAGPGDVVEQTYEIRNNGSLAADHLELSFAAAENDSGRAEPSDSSLSTELNATQAAAHLRVVTMEYRNASGGVLYDVRNHVSDANGNGIEDLADVLSQQPSVDGLTAPQRNGGNATYFVVELEVANADATGYTYTGSDEEFMADGVDVAVTFRLNQDTTQ